MDSTRNVIPFDDTSHRGGNVPAWDAPQPVAAQPFWGRCIRACVMVLLAASAHQWVLPRALSPLPAIPGLARASIVPVVGGAEPQQRSIVREPSVTVLTELVVISPPPVGTSGFVPDARPQLQSVSAGLAPQAANDVAPAEPAATANTAPVQPDPEPLPDVAPPPAAPVRKLPAPPVAVPTEQRSPQYVTAAMEGTIAPIRPAVVRSGVDHQQRVRQLIQQYASAFERLDVSAAKAVWPTVNEKALRRAFDSLEAQQVKFESCGITIQGTGAQARCHGEATYRPRVGSRTLHLSAREWTFDLAQAGDGWHIVDARVR